MGYVYRYTDLLDNTIKYVGIVWSENRTLQQRVKEHYMYDEWCNGKKWKIEYLEIDNKTDCEGLEGHFISLYNTSAWYNKGKLDWGISNIYSTVSFEWKVFNYVPEEIKIKKRSHRRINDRFLKRLYDHSIYIFNNGRCYCFFNTLKKEPVYVYMALSPDEELYAFENNIRYMNREQLDSLIRMVDKDKKSFGYSQMPSELEQIKIENNLKIEQCFTYKEQCRIFGMITEKKIRLDNLNIDLNKIHLYIRNYVYEMTVDIERMQKQKQGKYSKS